jgi:Flp pilus assembly protein TadB
MEENLNSQTNTKYTVGKALQLSISFFFIVYGALFFLAFLDALGVMIIMAYIGIFIGLFGLYVVFYIFKTSKQLTRIKSILFSVILAIILFHSLALILVTLSAFHIIPMGSV